MKRWEVGIHISLQSPGTGVLYLHIYTFPHEGKYHFCSVSTFIPHIHIFTGVWDAIESI